MWEGSCKKIKDLSLSLSIQGYQCKTSIDLSVDLPVCLPTSQPVVHRLIHFGFSLGPSWFDPSLYHPIYLLAYLPIHCLSPKLFYRVVIYPSLLSIGYRSICPISVYLSVNGLIGRKTTEERLISFKTGWMGERKAANGRCINMWKLDSLIQKSYR